MEIQPEGPDMMIIVTVGFVLVTLLWLAGHVAGLVMTLTGLKTRGAPSTFTIVAWSIAFGSGFLGPLVILGNLVALVLAAIGYVKYRDGGLGDGDGIPLVTIGLTSSALLFGTTVFVLAIVFGVGI